MYSNCLSSQLYGHGRSSASSCCNPFLFTICFCLDFYYLLYDCFQSFFAMGPVRNCIANGSRSTVAIISSFRHSCKKMLDRHNQTFLFMLIESAHEGARTKPIAFLLVFLLTVIAIFSPIDCQPTYNYHVCSGPGNSTQNSNYSSNLSTLLNSISTKANLNSFYKDTSDGIYSLYFCRGDVSSNTCQTCISTAIQDIQQRCASNRTGIIWYDECVLRYTDNNFFGLSQTSPRIFLLNIGHTTSPDELNFGALALKYTLIDNVPYSDKKFGTNESATPDGSQHRYALVQCSLDINSSDCSSCLGMLRDSATQCCQAKIGWRILAPSCSLRYEENRFYQLPSTPGPAAPPPLPGNGESKRKTPTDLFCQEEDKERPEDVKKLYYYEIWTAQSICIWMSKACN